MIAKGAYLKQLTAATSHLKTVEVGKDMEGSSPPSVFIGSWNYPEVFAGPMIAPVHGDTAVMDMPESWISGSKTQEEIIGYRLNLVRGIRRVHVSDLENGYIGKLQEISLSERSVESEVSFTAQPQGMSFSEEHTPFGPRAPIERFEIEGERWNRDLEKVYYDTDLKSREAVTDLHKEGLPFSSIQKAFSTGTMGIRSQRHLVPTRWSITACDTMIGDHLLKEVKKCSLIDTWRVHEFASLHNRYAVILMPTDWQYEWTEAFFHVMGTEELVFSDFEGRKKKSTYSPLGGCYYTCKMAVLEALEKERKQAGVIVLREALNGYVPMGVFNVRENVRGAMLQPAQEFEGIRDVLSYLGGRLFVPMTRFIEAGTVLRDTIRERQSTLGDFSCPARTDTSLPDSPGSAPATPLVRP